MYCQQRISSTTTPNTADLLPLLFWRLSAMKPSVRAMLIFKGEPILVTPENSAKFVHRDALEQWPQLRAVLESWSWELPSELVGEPPEIKRFDVK
jgi:hypothetical protein